MQPSAPAWGILRRAAAVILSDGDVAVRSVLAHEEIPAFRTNGLVLRLSVGGVRLVEFDL